MSLRRTVIRWAVCLFTVLSLSTAFLGYPVQASATGCMAADVTLFDAGSGKIVKDESIYANLKGELYENGKLIAVIAPLSSNDHGTRLILGVDPKNSFSDQVKFKLGNQYRFKLILPQGYVLDRFDIEDCSGSSDPLPKGYKISGDSVTFTYDKEIQKQVQRGGMGGGFVADHHVKNVSAANGPLTTEIKLAKTDYKLGYGAKAFSLNAKVVNGSALTYKSDDTSVITVDKKGKITVKKPGRATVTINSKASGQYGGQAKKVTFTVLPKKAASVKTISPGKRKIKVTWGKVPYASGYKIQYADNKNMKRCRTATVNKGTTLSKTIGGLSSGKYTYVRVQAYSTKKGVVIMGKWSKVTKSVSKVR